MFHEKKLGETVCLCVQLRPWDAVMSLSTKGRIKWLQTKGRLQGGRRNDTVWVNVEIPVELLLDAGGDIKPNGDPESPMYLKDAARKVAAEVFLASGAVPSLVSHEVSVPVFKETIREHVADVEAQRCRREQREAELAAKADARQAAEDAYRQERDLWVAEHGSDRLRQALRLGLLESSDKVYREERLAQEYLGWRWSVDGEEHREPRNPTKAEMDVLESVREWSPDAEMAFVVESARNDNYFLDEDDDRYMAIVTRILGHVAVFRCPDEVG